jgi:aryl-alcohol dehydrogenase-like predicted oxidoreductase
MNNRKLESSQVQLSELGFGTSSYQQGTKGRLSSKEFEKLINIAIENGITHIDTAKTYLGGKSESWVGQSLSNLGVRKDVTIATKSHLQASSKKSKQVIDHSFEQLAVEYIDIYYIHWPKEGISSAAMLQTLFDYKEKGLIGAVGVCNYPVSRMQEWISDFPIDLYQLGYSLLWRIPELEIIPFCHEHNIGLVSYSSLAQGLLTPRIFPKVLPDEDVRRNSVLFRDNTYQKVLATQTELKAHAISSGLSIQTLAIGWLLSQRAIKSVLFNASTEKQLYENISAYKNSINNEIIKNATKITDELKHILPHLDTLFS